jgi:uncharacterized phage protein gp47/JayE
MALIPPTTKELSGLIISGIEAEINQAIPVLPKSFTRVLSRVLAAAIQILFKYAGFVFLQIFITRASFQSVTVNGVEIVPLIEWGRTIGVGDPDVGTQAELNVEVVPITQGATLPAGTQLTSSVNGFIYSVKQSTILAGATVQVVVKSVNDPDGNGGVGTLGNLDAGDKLSFVDPLAIVERSATVLSQAVTAADSETEEAYRQRVLFRFQNPPQGGAYADYVIWGTEIEGIINIYPFSSTSPGQVDVYAEATEASSGSPDGIPTAAQLEAVADSIQLTQDGLASRRPIGAFVNVLAITRLSFDVEVSNLVVEDTAEVQQQISDSLVEYFLSRENYIEGVTRPPIKTIVYKNDILSIVNQIVVLNGGTYSDVVLIFAAVPIANKVLLEGEKAKLGNLTFTV